MTRIAFLGQGRYFLPASFTGISQTLQGKFFDLDQDDDEISLLESIERFDPDVLVYFRPDMFPHLTRLLQQHVDVPTIGFLTEPVTGGSILPRDNIRDRRKYLKGVINQCAVSNWI